MNATLTCTSRFRLTLALTMSSVQGPEAQNALFDDLHPKEAVPAALERATDRLEFPPSYVVVGIYRLFTDKTLLVPTWKKCEHATIRGLGVGLVWVRC